MTIVAISGATGFVGRALLRDLAARSVETVALIRPGTHLPEAGQSRDLPDLAELAAGQGAVDFAAIDVFVHCAAIPQSRRGVAAEERARLFAVNATATKVLADQAAAAGVKRFILLSSAKVNGESTEDGQAFTASDTPLPFDDYAKSKLQAEQLLAGVGASTGMETVVIRPPLVYGAGVKGNFVQLVRLAARGWPLPLGAIQNRRSMVAMDNLADLIATAIDHPAATGGTFMVSDGEDLSTPDLLTRLAKLQGARAWLPAVPPALLQTALGLLGRRAIADRLTGSLRVDDQPTRQTLGWTPRIDVDEALRRTIAG